VLGVGGVGVRVCKMRIVSWNVHGLGGLEKRKEVKELVKDKVPLELCIQETKLQVIDGFLCTSLWGPSNHDFSYSPSVGASGGLVAIWDTSEVEVWLTARGEHFLMIHGRFIKSNEEFYIFNVYAPCDRSANPKSYASLFCDVLCSSSLLMTIHFPFSHKNYHLFPSPNEKAQTLFRVS